MEHEAHRKDLDRAFKDENYAEDQVDLLLRGRPVRFVIRLQTYLVVCGCQHERIQNNGERDKVIEPAPSGEPDECLAHRVLIRQQEQAHFAELVVFSMHME